MRPPAALAQLPAVLGLIALSAGTLFGQASEEPRDDLADRPITAIEIEGLQRVSEQLVRNQLRAAVGDPYDPETVKGDVERLYRLGEFDTVTAEAEMRPDGAVGLAYIVDEAAIIAEIQVVGNKVISDQDLLAATGIERGLPRDDFEIETAKRAIENKYRERGHYLTTVTVDESQLEESGILFFRVIEGPRVKVKAIEFEGNDAFADSQLHAEIETRTAFPLLRRGELDEERLVDDVARLHRFYRDRGYLDARVDRLVELSPDSTEVKVTFLIVEGRRYTLRSVTTDPSPLKVFSREQIEAMLVIKPGDVYRRDKIERSLQIIRDAYGLLGFLDPVQPNGIRYTEFRASDAPEVDLLLEISEGRPSRVGTVEIIGNFLTKDRVIRRHLRHLRPGQPLDAREIRRARERILNTRLFSDVNITIQDPDPEHPAYRNIVVEVKESNTGSVNFGIAAGSDTGVFGELSLTQRNFDITDLPESPQELLSGRAFRGGGQRFSMTLRPGDEIFQYIMSWREPALFDSNWSMSTSFQVWQRQFNSQGVALYEENRISVPFSFGRQLGDVWNFQFTGRFERVRLDSISPLAPVDVFQAAGPDTLVGLGLQLTRSTVTTFQRPGEGTRFEAGIEQVGLFLGDIEFTKITADYTVFLTLHRDFFGRRSILRLNARAGYILDDAPLYERFYLGGRSFRGFEFRTVSPKGLDPSGMPTTFPVGGDWLFFLGAQYDVPLIEDLLTGVVFLDSGTVTNDPGFDEYRVSIGAGLRIYVPQFGPVPIALDFGFPLVKEPTDEDEVFSFSAELPF